MLKSRVGALLVLTLIVALVVLVVIQGQELAHQNEAARLRQAELAGSQKTAESEGALKQMQDYQAEQRREIQRLQAQTKSLESELSRLRSKQAAKKDSGQK